MPSCPYCKQERQVEEFVKTKSPFHPKGHSLICVPCLERIVPSDDLAKIDQMCRWLDIPFLIDQWTRLQRNAKERTLRLYIKLLEENASYSALDWSEVNEKWRLSIEAGTIQDQIPTINEAWRAQMRLKWPSDMDRSDEDYHYLENFYQDLCTTQNLVSATQRDDAKRLCEVGLLATQKIRAGLDAKNEMAIYHNIVKTEGFEPKNAKNVGDFDSVGELYTWLEKRGWKPKWHTEPQDSVDFTIKNIQKYLQRLVMNEGAIGDQVENRKKQLELANKMEEEYVYDDSSEDVEIEYEGAAELEEMFDDDDALN